MNVRPRPTLEELEERAQELNIYLDGLRVPPDRARVVIYASPRLSGGRRLVIGFGDEPGFDLTRMSLEQARRRIGEWTRHLVPPDGVDVPEVADA